MRTPEQITHHLLDGHTIVVPHLAAGHYPALDPRAHTVITELIAWGSDLVRHPYNGQSMGHVLADNQRHYTLALERMAHLETCPDCANIWDHYTALATELEPGETLSAVTAMTNDDNEPTIHLIADAVDLDPETNPYAPR